MSEFAVAPQISPDSWLREERFECFVSAYRYAATQSLAIQGLSKLTPEQAYHVYTALRHGAELCDRDVGRRA